MFTSEREKIIIFYMKPASPELNSNLKSSLNKVVFKKHFLFQTII